MSALLDNTILVEPKLPPLVVNGLIVVAIAALWPADWLFQEYMDPYFVHILTLIAINITLAVSLNLINGITGQFSLGHAGFMAIGAYTAGVLMKHYNPAAPGVYLAYPAAVAVGGLLAAAAGLLVGIPALRLRGDYLAIATLGFGEIINVFLNNTDRIGGFEVGGSAGLHAIPIHTNLFWAFGLAIVCVVCVWRLAHSTRGKAFLAVREDEIAAAAMGVDTTYHKVAAFVIGAFFAGTAGAVSAMKLGNLDPGGFRFMRSIEFVVMVVLGGSGSITGSIVAAAVLTILPEMLRDVQQWRMITYSVLLIVMMLVRPEGLLGSRELWWTRRRLAGATGPGPTSVPPAEPPLSAES